MSRFRPMRPLAAVPLLLALAAPAAAAGVKVTVDRNEVALDEQIVMSVTVEGSATASPRLPELPAFEVYRGGQSTQVSLINGRRSLSVTHQYLLSPRETGIFTVGPAIVEVDGTVHASEPFQIRVLEASEAPSGGRDLFTTVQVSSTRPFVGQQVLYTWRLYRRVRIGDARLEPVEFAGFLVEDLGEVREFESVVGGQAYLVSEIRKALIPQESGRLEIPATRLSCQVLVRERAGRSLFDDVFGSSRAENRVLRTQPIELEARPLPPAPAGYSGLVGSFELDASISRRDLSVGESTTLEMTLRGRGNVQMIPEPALPQLAAVKVYDDKPESKIDRTGDALSGSRTFRKALVPMEPGELAIPEVAVTYFDPEAETYRTVTSPPIVLSVRPAEGREDLRLTESVAPTTGKVAVRILADDILPLHKGEAALASATRGESAGSFLALALLLPPVAFLGMWSVQRRRRLDREDSDRRRRRHALRRARRALREAARGPDGESAVRASRCLREYIGDKLGLEGSALTAAEAGRLLASRAVDPATIERTRALLDRLEAARYGGETAAAADPAGEVGKLVASLERELR